MSRAIPLPRLLGALLILAPLFAAACLPSGPPQAEAGSRPLRYVAIGASDAVGVGARSPETEGWVARFHAALPPGSSLVNLGVSGSKLAPALQQQLPVALASQPDVVTVWLAVNDLADGVPLERYRADLDTLLASLDSTGALVLVGNVPDLTLLPAFRSRDPDTLAAQIGAWNSAIAEIVDRHGAVLVDLRSRWREHAEHPEYTSGDGFHPSTEGYARLAAVFRQAYLEHPGPRGAGG